MSAKTVCPQRLQPPAWAVAFLCISRRQVVVVPLIINPCIDVFKCARASKGCSDIRNEE